MLNAYETRRRYRLLVYLLALLLGLPPGWITRAHAATKRGGTLSRTSNLETFRNPQFSSAAHNRFLFSHSPSALLGGGGDSFSHPATAGYGSVGEPETQWLTDEGKVEWFAQDLFLPGVGLQLAFQRVWRGSVSSYDGPLGNRWDFGWNKRLSDGGTATNVTFYDMGRSEIYTYSAGNYSSPTGRYDSLVRQTTPDPDEYTRTDRKGIKETYEYDTSGGGVTQYRLKEIKDLNNNTLTFAYDGNRNLTKVTDTLSRDTTIAYDGNDRISTITDPASRVWAYAYDGSGNLTKVTTPKVDLDGDNEQDDGDFLTGKATTYKYDGSNRLTEILRPADDTTGTWKWSYDVNGKVTKHTKASDDINLAYDTVNRKVTVTDRESVVTRYEYDTSLRVTKREVFYTAEDHWDTTWAYDSNNEVTSIIFPRGNRILYAYDGSGNITTVTFKKDANDNTPIVWSYTYASNARVSTVTDPKGEVWDYNYDGSGNLTSKTAPAVTVPSGIATEDKNGNSNYDGTVVETWAYNSAGLVTTYTDPVGTDTAYTYTTVNSKPAYLATVVADSGGLNLTTAYGWDSKGSVTTITDPGGHSTTYTVNALNQLQQAVEPGTVTKKFWYDSNDRVTKTEASNDTTSGNSWYVVDNAYDQAGNLTSVIADLTSSTRITTAYAYDNNDRLTKVTSPLGSETVYAYDKRDLVSAVTRKGASAPDDIVTTTVYDENGNKVTVTDPRSNNTVYAYDLYDRLTKVTQPQGNYVEYAYDANGNVTSQTWKNSGNTSLAQTTMAYDDANRLYQVDRLAKKADLSTNLGDGTQSKTIWRDERGAVLEHSGDICGCSAYEHVYDAVGRQVTTKDPMGVTDNTRNLVVSEYDSDGNMTKQTRNERSQDTNIEANKDIVTEFVYDSRHRMVTRKEKLDATPTYGSTVYFFGLRDQVTKIVDPESDEVRFEHNEQLWKTKDTAENGASDVITEYTFDNDGRMLTYKAKNSNTGDQSTVYTYDKFDRVVTTTWPDSGTHVHVYDKAGNRVTTTDPNTTVVVAGFDSNNRLTSRAMTLATDVIGATSHTLGYDGMNRMIQADTSEGGAYTTELDWTWNTLSLKETEKQVINGYNSGNGRTITWTWNEEGDKTGVTYPVSGATLTYVRDDLGRVDTISRGGTQVVDYTFSGPRVLKKAYPGSHSLHTYDGYGRVTQIHHKDTSSGNSLAKFVYGYDKSHQVTSQDKFFYDGSNNRITTDTVDKGDQYDYDGAKRLVTVLRGVPTAYINDAIASNISNTRYDDLIEYNLDQTGNRLTRRLDGSNDRTYAYDVANEMTTEGGATQTYTTNGTWSGGASVIYKYAWNDQFAWWDQGPRQFTWHYDALGRQVARTRSGSGGASDIHVYYDGVHDVEVTSWISSTEALLRRMVYADRINELLEHTDVSADPDVDYYNHADKLDSVMVLAEADGDQAESYRYKEFGEQTVVDSSFTKLSVYVSSIGNYKRYTGQEHALPSSFGDPWYFYRTRAYRADAGRFVQRDSKGYSDGANFYSYVRSRPMNLVDPLGTEGSPPGWDFAKVVLGNCCLSGRKECCAALGWEPTQPNPPGPVTPQSAGGPAKPPTWDGEMDDGHGDPPDGGSGGGGSTGGGWVRGSGAHNALLKCLESPCANTSGFCDFVAKMLIGPFAARDIPSGTCINFDCVTIPLFDSTGKKSCAITTTPDAPGACWTMTFNVNGSAPGVDGYGLNPDNPTSAPTVCGTPDCIVLHEVGHINYGAFPKTPGQTLSEYQAASELHASQYASGTPGCQ